MKVSRPHKEKQFWMFATASCALTEQEVSLKSAACSVYANAILIFTL